jgi:hypothetical protein
MNARITLSLLAACLGFAAFECRSETVVGLHLLSAHIPAKDSQNNANWGLYARRDSWTVGAYHSTHKRTAAYVAYSLPLGAGFEVMGGVAYGYQEKCSDSTETVTTQQEKDGATYTQKKKVTTTTCTGFSRGALTPLAGLTYSPAVEVMGFRPRIWAAPGFGKSSTVIHLSVEKAL